MSEAVAWRGRLISFRTLTFIILGLGVVRLVVAFLLPQEPSIMAPDEGTYAALAGVVGSGGDWATWNYGWGAGLYPGSRALLGPAATLTSLGLPDLTAVRVISVLYAVGSQLLLLTIARLARLRIAPERPTGLLRISWPMLGVAVFVLMPSNVLWSNLGLREAACAFWILAAVTCAGYLFTTRDWRWKTICGVGVAASITMAFQSRVYLAVALVLALTVGIVWFGKERPRLSVTLAASVILGALLGITASLPATLPSTSPPAAELLAQAEELRAEATTLRRDAEENESASGAAEDRAKAEALDAEAERLIEQVEQAPDTGAFGALQQGAAAASEVINPDTYLERGSYQRDVSAQYANSAIATDSCVGLPNPQSLRWCEITRLPGAAFAVMFRPLWPLDIPAEWSATAVLASLENVAWLAVVASVIWVLVTRRFSMTRLLTIGLAYGALVVAGMAALEGNFGTAFRHKSSVLWVLCMVLALAGTLRRPRAQKPSPQPATPAIVS